MICLRNSAQNQNCDRAVMTSCPMVRKDPPCKQVDTPGQSNSGQGACSCPSKICGGDVVFKGTPRLPRTNYHLAAKTAGIAGIEALMTKPEVDIHGRALTERDKTLLDLLLRPGGASLERINRAMMAKAAYGNDSERLAERLGGPSWSSGERGARKIWDTTSLRMKRCAWWISVPKSGPKGRASVGPGGFVIPPVPAGAGPCMKKGKRNAGASGGLWLEPDRECSPR